MLLRWFTSRAKSRAERRRATQANRPRFNRQARLGIEELERRLAPANYSWTGAAGTLNWSDAPNWSGGVVPGASDNATINVAVSGPITISGTQSVNSLSDTTAALVLASGSFTLAAGSSVSKDFTESAGTLTPKGGLIVNSATFNFNGGAVTSGTVFLSSGSTLNCTAASTSGASFTFYNGTATLEGAVPQNATVRVQANGGSVTVNAADGSSSAGTLLLDSTNGNYSATLAVLGAFSNTGTVEALKDAGGGRVIGGNDGHGTLTNHGQLLVDPGITATFQNGTLVSDGSITANGTLYINSSTFDLAGGTVANAGAWGGSSSTVIFSGGAVTAGTVGLGNGDVLDCTAASTTGASFTFYSGTGTLEGAVPKHATVTVQANGGGNVTVNAADGSSSAGAVLLDSTNGNYSPTLVVLGAFTNTGTVEAIKDSGGGRVIGGNSGKGTLTNHGLLLVDQGITATFQNGTLASDGSITANGTLYINSSTFDLTGGTVANAGAWGGSSSTVIFSGGAVTAGTVGLGDGDTLDCTAASTSGASFTFYSGTGALEGAVPQNATVVVQANSGGGVTVNVADGTSSAGTVLLDDSSSGYTAWLGVGGAFTNTGTIEVLKDGGGSRIIDGNSGRGTLTNHGTLIVDSGITATFQSGTLVSDGSITANGTLYINSSTFDLTGAGSISVSGGLNVNSGTFNLAGGTVAAAGWIGGSSSTVNFSGGAVTSGTIDLGDGDTLDCTATSTAGASFTFVQGTGTLEGAVPKNATVVVQANNSYDSVTVNVADGTSNAGTVLLDDSSSGYTAWLGVGGAFTNTGTIEVLKDGGGSRIIDGNSGRGTLTNHGTLIVDSGITATFQSGTLVSDGSISANGGLNVNSGIFNLAGGTVAAAGWIGGSSSTVNFSGGAVTSGTIDLGDGDTLDCTATSTAGASFTFVQGTGTLEGAVPKNATVTVQANGNYGAVTVNVADGSSNAGAVLLDSNNGAYSATLEVLGAFANTGTIEVLKDAASGRTITGSLNNYGTILLYQSTNLGSKGAVYDNTGLIGLQPGVTLTVTGTSFTNESGAIITGGGALNTSGVTFTNRGIVDLTLPSVFDLEVHPSAIPVTYVSSGGMSAGTVTNPANYSVVGSGGDGIFGNGNDVNENGLISGITYNSTTGVATISFSQDLPVDVYQVRLNGDAIRDSSGNHLYPNGTIIVTRALGIVPAAAALSLDPGSNSGAPDHPGFTNVTKPTFDVQVNQAGRIAIDFDGNGTTDATLSVPVAGMYQLTAPKLADGTYTAKTTFNAATGVTGQGSMTYTIDTIPPSVASLSPTGTVYNGVSQATVTFSELVNLNTFIPSAITLTGPGGTIAVKQPQLISGTTYSIGFAAQTVPGTYTLTVTSSVTDFAANPMQQSFTGSFTIALPDLAVTATTAPAAAVEGSAVALSWTVTNASATNPATAPWTDTVYLSTLATLDKTATPLLSVAAPPQSPLAGNASYTRNKSVTLPGNIATGSYYLLFVANADGGQLESDTGNDGNDLVADPISLTAPDLQVTGVSGPVSGFNSQNVLVTWTDQNSGTASASGPWVDNVYAATDAKGSNPTLLGSFTFTGTLAVGASVQRTQQVALPATPGTYWLAVTTNATQTVPEGTNFNNNTTVAASSVIVNPVPLPDLVVSSITPPPNGVVSGTSVPISFVVKNSGTAPTSVPAWYDWVILSQDATLGQTYQGQLNGTGPGGDQTLCSQPVVAGFANPSYLAVGDSYQQNVDMTLPISAQGTWYVYVVPDGTGAHHPFAMPEISRTDKLALSAGFSVTLSPPPDLAASGVKAPDQDFSGQPMNVSWTVTNSGTGPTAASAWTDAVYMSPVATLDSKATLLGTFAHQGALAVGGSYSSSQSVTLPVGVSGSFYFLVQTDLYGQVFENGQTGNNVGATATAKTINLTPPPDLKPTSISPPTTAVAGHGLTFSYTVTNAGAGDTPNYTWDDSLYLSPTTTFDAKTAIPLGTPTHQGILAVGAAYTNTVTATVPNGLTGSYYLFVTTDSGNVVFELNKANNRGGPAGTIQVTAAPPDLIVSAAGAPAAALSGSAILVHWTVTNNSTGDTAVSAWQDSVYVDTGATLSSNAVLLGSFAHYGLVSGNGSYSQTQLLTLPINLVGAYNLFVVTNSSGAVYESSTSNNTSAPLPITISVQLPGGGGGGGGHAAVADLQPTSVTGPATALTGGSVTVNWTVQNNGPGATNANYWNDDVWMSTNATLGSGGTDVYLGTVQHTNSLAAGASYSASGTFTLPGDLAAGPYYFIAATDRPVAPPNHNEGVNLVYETNETNNETADSTTTAVAVGPTPELTVSNVTAPTTATSGGQLPVGWTVTNGGADTGIVAITDSVYLSFDRVFDPTDRYLGSVTYPGGLAGGASYTQNATIPLPSGVAGTFYVFVVTNSNHSVYERNPPVNTAYAPQSVQVTLPAPADLVAGTVTIPATALAGQDITITYQVSNNGSNPANGSWVDALYLSPAPAWNVSDSLLGRVSQTQNLAHGASYTGTLTAPLPGVAPGAYYVIVRSNILDTLPELTLANNLSASLTQTAIDAPALTLGTAANGTLGQEQATYWKVVVSEGQTLQISFTSQSAAAHDELYVSYGTMPTRSQYDFRYGQPFAANQQVTVPTTRAGAYYILAYGASVPSAPESYAITAAILSFSIQAVTPGQAGAGPVTLRVSGAQFDFATTFQLKANGTVINATRTLWQDSATAFATFDLTGQALGSYDISAIQSDGTSTTLAAGLGVVAATPVNSVRLGLIVPQSLRVGRPGTITVTYANPGNTDLPAPLLLLDGQNALLQAPGQAGYAHSALQLYGFNPDGPFGTLPPGFRGSVTVSFKPATAGAGLVSNFTLETLQDPSEPFDWNALAANDVPVNTSATQWSGMVSQAAPLLGGTWGAVVSFLGNDSVQLVKNETARTAPAILNSLYNFDGLLQDVVGIYGAGAPVDPTPPFPVIAQEGEVTVYNAHVDASGNPIPLNSSYPTFVITHGLNGYRDDFGALAEAIANDSDCFPDGHANVLIVTWQGATSGPTVGGTHLPWVAAQHIDTAGAELGDILGSFEQQGLIDAGTTTAIGESFGNYVNNAAAGQVGGLGGAIALNPATGLGGYLPPDLRRNFQHSTSYETSSLFDTQRNIAESNYTLDTGDINNPSAQHTFGVPWLTRQVLAGSCDVLNPGPAAGPGALPPGNDPPSPSDPTGLPESSAPVVQIAPHDPNSIIGPKGSGTFALVATSDPLPYSILFTNLATAQASAQQVIVKQQLSSNLAWGSFRLGNFGFRGQTYSVPANSAYYQTTIDLARQFGFDVAVTATIDESTGIATWTFTTLDPATGEVPLDPTLGFLPPDDASGDGEGFVSYTIQAASTDATGTVITAQATITFDTQPPLDTPVISNTVDAGTGLAGTVAALPAFEPAQFNVSWSGSDAANGSAVRYFTVYVSDNGGPSTAWLKNTALTSAPFVGVDGHTYAFASVASDNAGNVQPVPATSQATTTVDAVAPTSTVAALPSISPAPFTVSWSGSDNAGGSGVASFSIFVSRDGGAFAAWLTNTAQTSAVYPGADGHSYAFYSVATDNAGNRQSTPASAQASTAVVGVTRAVVNGDLAALAGAQRSMVRDLVYTFNHAVTLAAGAFTIALHANVTVNGVTGQTVGVLPTLSYSTADGGVTWVVTFSGAGVVNGSIADGVYDLTLHASAVTDELGQALSADRVDTFYRLFGDAVGNRKVNNADLAVLASAFNKRSGQSGYRAYLDYDGNGVINNSDLAQFAARFNDSFGF